MDSKKYFTTGGMPVTGQKKAMFPRWVSVVASENPASLNGMIDVFVHFSLWIVVLVLEIMFFVKCKHTAFLFDSMMCADSLYVVIGDEWHTASGGASAVNPVPFQYAAASLSMVVVAMTVQISLTVLYILNVIESTPERLDPYLLTLINAPLNVSMIFTLVANLFATDIKSDIVTDGWRTVSIVLIIFKTMLMAHLKINSDQIGSKADARRIDHD